MSSQETNHYPQLLSAKALAKMLSLSPRTVFRLRASNKLPAPVRVGGSIRWDHETVSKWISMGCPDRKEFEMFAKMAEAGQK